MGKKVKGLVKGITKVATLGAIDGSKGGWLGGTKGLLSLGTLGASDAVGGLVNPKLPEAPDMSGLQSALQAQATNANIDLGLNNVADIQAGGTADSQNATRRRRSGGAGGVASSLGVRV